MPSTRRPNPPAGLGKDGRALWRSIVGDLDPGLELDARERHLLGRACRAEDEMRKLEGVVDRDGLTVEGSRGQTVVHPAVSEIRQMRLVQLRLLSVIEMVDALAARLAATPAQAQARNAAEVRWDLDRQRKRQEVVRPIRRPPNETVLMPEVEALDPVRHGWYRRYIREGFTHAEALRKARAYTPAHERFRAVDRGGR